MGSAWRKKSTAPFCNSLGKASTLRLKGKLWLLLLMGWLNCKKSLLLAGMERRNLMAFNSVGSLPPKRALTPA